MSQLKSDEYLLGNSSLHLQLSTALAVMTHLICNVSRPPNAQQMSESMELSSRHLRKLMRTLSAGGLLQPHASRVDTWICPHPPHTISLADIYQCLTRADDDGGAPFIPPPQVDAAGSSADLLMMQATMAINQTVMQQLQRFDLGRLKAAESAMLFTAALRQKAWLKVGKAVQAGNDGDLMEFPLSLDRDPA
jgi:DNA-binding IscR family transcriptional regulator